MTDAIILAVVALIAGIVIGEWHLVSDVARGVRAAVRRRRERRTLERAYPRMWVDHMASLNTPACRRRQRIEVIDALVTEVRR